MKILVTISGLWLGFFILEKIFEFGLKNNQNLKLAAIKNSPPCSQLLIHGPCEPLWMISPALLDPITGVSSYNLALSHSDFADNYLHLYLYLKSNKVPGYLLLYITPESLDKHYNTFNTYRFAPYLDDPVVEQVVSENDPEYFKWTKFPFMKYAYYNNKFTFQVVQGYKHYFTDKKTAHYQDGFEPPTKRVWSNHTGEFVDLYKKKVIFEPDTLREKYLVKLLHLAKNSGIEVFLYESPVLFESLPTQSNRLAMINRIDSIAKAEHVSFIKFDSLPMARNKKYFISTLNFNMKGVEIFNDTLATFIRRNILRK